MIFSALVPISVRDPCDDSRDVGQLRMHRPRLLATGGRGLESQPIRRRAETRGNCDPLVRQGGVAAIAALVPARALEATVARCDT